MRLLSLLKAFFFFKSETWTLKKGLEYTTDTLGLLRNVIPVKWPKMISDDRLNQRTNVKQRSTVVCKRRQHGFVIHSGCYQKH